MPAGFNTGKSSGTTRISKTSVWKIHSQNDNKHPSWGREWHGRTGSHLAIYTEKKNKYQRCEESHSMTNQRLTIWHSKIWIHLSTGTKQQKHFHPCGISRLHVSIMSDKLGVQRWKKKKNTNKNTNHQHQRRKHAGVKTAKYNLHQNIFSGK